MNQEQPLYNFVQSMPGRASSGVSDLRDLWLIAQADAIC